MEIIISPKSSYTRVLFIIYFFQHVSSQFSVSQLFRNGYQTLYFYRYRPHFINSTEYPCMPNQTVLYFGTLTREWKSRQLSMQVMDVEYIELDFNLCIVEKNTVWLMLIYYGVVNFCVGFSC